MEKTPDDLGSSKRHFRKFYKQILRKSITDANKRYFDNYKTNLLSENQLRFISKFST